jgi:hypothetical protein
MIAIRLAKGLSLAFGIALTFQLGQENLNSTFARVFLRTLGYETFQGDRNSGANARKAASESTSSDRGMKMINDLH